MTAASVLACLFSGLTLSTGSWQIVLMISLMTSISIRLQRVKVGRLFTLLLVADALLLFTIVSMVGAALSYVAMRHSGALTDGMLDSADRAMGLSWIEIRDGLDAHPLLLECLGYSYWACFVMPFIVVSALALTDRQARLYRFVAVYGACLLITVAIAYFFPAEAAFEYYGYSNVPPNAAHYGDAISGLRNGSLIMINLPFLAGIITFPSFHACMAIIFVWALWPVKLLRWPALILNALMWISAIPIGGHYVIDVAGGSLVALTGVHLPVMRRRQTAGLKLSAVELRLPSQVRP